MKQITIFRHVDCEGPGYFADVLQRENIPYTVVCIDQGESFSSAPDENRVAALVFMGGHMSVNDDLPWIKEELRLIQNAVDKQIPIRALSWCAVAC